MHLELEFGELDRLVYSLAEEKNRWAELSRQYESTMRQMFPKV